MRFFLLFLVLGLSAVVTIVALDIQANAVDLISHFHWHFVGIAAGLAGAALLLRAWRIAGLASLVAVFALYQTQRFDAVFENAGRFGRGEKVLRLASINIWGRISNSRPVLHYLRTRQPDFVFLQEINLPTYEDLKALSDIYPHIAYCSHSLCRSVFLSKHAWKAVSWGRKGRWQLPTVNALYGPHLGNLQLFGIHAARPSHRSSTQRRQLEEFAQSLRKETGPIIVGGDFNGTAFSQTLRNFGRASGLKHAGFYLTTWPKRTRHLGDLALPFTQFGLDQFYISDNVRLIHVERGPDLGSDHLPMFLTFSVKSL